MADPKTQPIAALADYFAEQAEVFKLNPQVHRTYLEAEQKTREAIEAQAKVWEGLAIELDSKRLPVDLMPGLLHCARELRVRKGK